NDIRENLPLPLNIIPYCIRPSNISNIWNTSSAIIIQDTVHSFYELRVNNVTDRKLYRWSVDTNKIEKYQKYVEQFHLNSIEGKEVLYNCSQAWFGSKCEYTFNSHLTTFDQIVNERFDMKEEYDPAEILRITNGTCYWHLKCDQESSILSLLASKVVAVIVIIFTITTAIQDPLNRRLIVDEEDQRTWCVVSYVHLPSVNIFNTGLNITHFILPFAINFISAFIIILTTARKRSIARTQQTYGQHLRNEFQQHKHLIISPCILVLLALPRLIISFFSGCMKSERNPWLYFAGYFVSFISPMTTFLIFVIPSETYKTEFYSALKRYCIAIKRLGCRRN
ncbi:unnamed protein product, partial [Didymodactylos carnosus]